MSKFYIIGKISRDLAKRMQSDPNADRGAAIKTICETVGVKFHSYEWVRGRFDVINIIEGDYESVLGMKVAIMNAGLMEDIMICLLYTSPSPRDRTRSRMPSSA